MRTTQTKIVPRLSRNFVLVLFILSAALPVFAFEPSPAQTTAKKSWSVRWQPTRLVNGAPIVFRVAAPTQLDSLRGTWLGHQVVFDFDPGEKTWSGIAGVSLETRAGSYALALQGMTTSGSPISFQTHLTITRTKYRSVAVSVPRQYTEPDPEQLQQISQDKAVKEDRFARVSPKREWSGGFRPPVKARISDVFGTRRTFNGELQSTHQGLDYAVPQGTAVSALNRGSVLLARPLFFEGNCVVIDHGQGLLTLYMHLSEIKAKEGEQVSRGQVIGLSGGTGRATGPHLHIAVRWQGVYLNPTTLLNLRLP